MNVSPKQVSVADMKAAFPVEQLPPIQKRPNLYELLKLLKIICRCSQTTKSSLGPLGYLFVALPDAHYTRYTNVPLVRPVPPMDVPPFTANMGPAAQE